MKQGRNEMCNCGSGKKFKKCCLSSPKTTQSTTLIKRNKGTLPSWFPNEFLKKQGGEVVNKNHPNPEWKNKKVKLTKEELSMYWLLKRTETELMFYSEYHPKENLIKMQQWMQMGLMWFRKTNPTGYMRLLD